MKVLYFHLMPYLDLPSDFREKYSSVWIDVDSRLVDSEKVHRNYNDFLDELEYAAECGFDAICVNEHHANAYGQMPSPNLMAAALARRTKDAAICVMGNSLALYNPPTRVAEEFAMIDCISGGRLIAGFPVGSPMDTAYAYGMNPSQLRQKYQEAHDLILKGWSEQKAFPFNGRFYQQRYVNILPKPIQRPHPPIWIPGGGSTEAWRWCGEMNYVYCYLSYYGHKYAEEGMKGFWNEMDAMGIDRNPYRAGLLQFVGVAESRSEAIERYTEAAEYFYGRCLHLDPRFASPPGYVTEGSQRANMTSQVVKAAGATAGERFNTTSRDMQGIVDKGYVIVGSPDDVVEQLRDVSTRFNIGNLLLLLHFGNMDKSLANYNTRLFAEKVLPKLKDLHSQWPHHWWPQPMRSGRADIGTINQVAAE